MAARARRGKGAGRYSKSSEYPTARRPVPTKRKTPQYTNSRWVEAAALSDHVTPDRRSAIMRAVGTKDTGPELAVRRILHAFGYRYRLYRRDLPGTPDLTFPRDRKAIFVHGCFWHGHGCKIGRLPKSKLGYWGPKIAANRARDSRNRRQLRSSGWAVLTVWQCELKAQDKLVRKLVKFLGPR